MNGKGRGEKKFLVVNAQSSYRKTLTFMLGQLGYKNVEEAVTGEEALARLQEEKIDFVISEWDLPQMSGYELLQNIRESDEMGEIPFILIMGTVREDVVTQAAETEVDGCIVKPFDTMTVEKKITTILDRKENPSLLEQLAVAGDGLRKAGKLDEAYEKLQSALELQPGSARILTLIGMVQEKKGDLSGAEKSYRGAIDSNPIYTRAHEALGRMLYDAAQYEEAELSFRRAASISPNNVDRQLLLGRTLISLKKFTEADDVLKQAVKSSSKDRGVRAKVEEIYFETQLADKAIESLREMIKQDPEAMHAYNRLGIMLRKHGRKSEAIEEYKKALWIEPNNDVLHYNLGRVYVETGDLAKAELQLEKCVQINGGFEEARKLLSQVAAHNRKMFEAERGRSGAPKRYRNRR